MTTKTPPTSLFKPAVPGTAPFIWTALRNLARPVEGLSPYPGNARNGDTDKIGESIDLHGQYAPIVYQLSTGYVIKGNHVLHAILERGWEWVAATPLDVDDDHARRIVLMDNDTSDAGRYDDPLLAALLAPFADTGDWEGTGFDQHRYLDLLDKLDRDATAVLDAAAQPAPAGPGPVVSYALVFDNAGQQSRWYAFLKWLRTSGVPGDTIGARIDSYLQGVIPEDMS